jgi:hypothetical protein
MAVGRDEVKSMATFFVACIHAERLQLAAAICPRRLMGRFRILNIQGKAQVQIPCLINDPVIRQALMFKWQTPSGRCRPSYEKRLMC